MARLSRVLRSAEGGLLVYWCQGCADFHSVRVSSATGSNWAWNGDVEKPTFSPSVLVKSGHYVDGDKGSCWCRFNEERREAGEPEAPFQCQICHTFVRDGMVEFLGDCTHALAGKTLPLPEYPDDASAEDRP